jgi:hypothetical protein
VECSKPSAPACKTVEQHLSDSHVPNSSAVLGSSAGSKVLRVILAPWSAIKSFTGAVATLKGPPSASGVFARFSQDGNTLTLEDVLGKPVRPAPPGTGLVAATALESSAPVWLITGLDDAGVNAAANALDAKTLHNAFALAVTPSGPLHLPVAGGSGG